MNRDSAAKMGKYARCATIYHTIASIVIQTGVNFTLTLTSKSFYVLGKEYVIIPKKLCYATAIELKSYSTFTAGKSVNKKRIESYCLQCLIQNNHHHHPT